MISMELLFMCFPLMEDRFLKDFLYRVTGEPDRTYLFAKLTDFWQMIPESPSKDYVKQYAYFHLTHPSVDVDPELTSEKGQEYYIWRTSRAYREQKRAYDRRLSEFRSKLILL